MCRERVRVGSEERNVCRLLKGCLQGKKDSSTPNNILGWGESVLLRVCGTGDVHTKCSLFYVDAWANLSFFHLFLALSIPSRVGKYHIIKMIM